MAFSKLVDFLEYLAGARKVVPTKYILFSENLSNYLKVARLRVKLRRGANNCNYSFYS